LPAIVTPYAKSRLRHLPTTQAIYRRLQTAFTAGWRSWVGLRREGFGEAGVLRKRQVRKTREMKKVLAGAVKYLGGTLAAHEIGGC